jgi:hypothetical protein
MIDKQTPERIAKLGQTIAEASHELDRTLLQLAAQADAELAAAAQMFILEHAKPIVVKPGEPPLPDVTPAYLAAQEALRKAVLRATNLRKLGKSSEKFKASCQRLRQRTGQTQSKSIKTVCDGCSK